MDSTAVPIAEFNPFDPRYRGYQRYDVLAPYREADPPLAVDPLGRTWLFRYDDVQAALVNSSDLGAMETSFADAMGFEEGCPFHAFQQHVMVSQNPPRHTRLRKAHGPGFGKHQLKPLVPAIRELCSALIDEFPRAGVVEFVSEFAFKLPVGVIMRILNLPPEDAPRIRELSPRLLPGSQDPEEMASCNAANAGLRAYAEEAMAQRRECPLEGDLVSDMLALEREGGLSHDEVWAQLVGLVFAGHETTTGSLSLLMHTLLEWPDQLQALRGDPSLVSNAAYEILRFEPPVDPVVRRVHTSWELHGGTFEEGALICPCLAAANRDPRQFPDPDRFDVRRRNALRHLGFGGGIHRCLGASLAVLELQIALEMLLERVERFELAGEPQLATDRLFRGFESLPLYVERRD